MDGMNELRRMQYLDARGVDMFVPRVSLPGAKPSKPCRLPLAAKVPSAPHSGTAVPSTAPTRSLGDRTLADLVTDEASGVPQEPARKRPAVTAVFPEVVKDGVANADPEIITDTVADNKGVDQKDAVKPVRYSLNFWHLPPEVMVIDSRQPASGLPVDTLMLNIVKAMEWASSLPRCEVQNWPVAGAEGRTSEGDGYGFLQSYIETRLEKSPVQALWVMGEEAFNSVVGVRSNIEYQESLFDRCEIEGLTPFVVVLPGLIELLQTPSLKRRVWQQISTLNS